MPDYLILLSISAFLFVTAAYNWFCGVVARSNNEPYSVVLNWFINMFITAGLGFFFCAATLIFLLLKYLTGDP